MDESLAAVGARIRSLMPLGMSQRVLAVRTGMKPDALSRALNGQRGFSTTELARVAEELGADLYWLVTGNEDPHRVRIAARHSWDQNLRVSTNPGRSTDDEVLAHVVHIYSVAFPDGPPAGPPLPDSAVRMREVLGADFVGKFAAVAEERLGVDVVRVSGLTTDYSLTIGARAVVLLATTPSWFRSNWSLAHELAHLALGHHGDTAEPAEREEAPANRFAAELLLPREVILQGNWQHMDERGLANFLWRTGVSTAALKNRLDVLRVQVSSRVAAAMQESTPRLIRAHADAPACVQSVIVRQQRSSARRFPSTVVDALQSRVEIGAASPRDLAWVLDVPIDEIDFPEPDDEQLAEAYAERLQDRPSTADLKRWAAGSRQAG
ncbi:helix-turn-helix domain-containing protein [Nocardia vermiculata]|uniref:ImmA/IrrE family metallo-endopeptidase n=1 Tax=Nocardia vermiculata TaxID=257274 RepID=A0A846XVM5_9NOCA|nr:XRE family transcriptional regulator [Nocardia vermiculata]NKY49685.1 ImmA/IrrE family metallo-endopeptidase [Nocardia vermiculata]